MKYQAEEKTTEIEAKYQSKSIRRKYIEGVLTYEFQSFFKSDKIFQNIS